MNNNCYNALMDFLKKAFRGLASFFYIWLILAVAIVTAVVMTFNSPKKIEKSLNDSGVYKTFVSGVLQEAQKSSQKNNGSTDSNDLPVSDPAIVAAANKAFTPQLLQTMTETVLDGTYSWLSGNTKTPDFTIDLTAAKQSFASAVGETARDRVAGLPACTTTQLRTFSSTDIDAFKITCRPPGVSLAQVQQQATDQINSSKDFLGTPKITPDNLPKDSNGRTVFENASKAPKVYKWVNASPWLLAILAMLAGLIAFFLHESRRRAARNLAIATTTAGGILLLGYLGTTTAFHSLSQPTGKLGQAVKGSFQPTIINAMRSINSSIEHTILWFAITYLVLGIGTLVALHFIKPKGSKPEVKDDKKQPAPPADDSPNQDNPKTEPKPKPAQG
jgi:hypothetical protein